MQTGSDISNLTQSQADYIHAIWLLQRLGPVRLRDICAARQVRPGSASPAIASLQARGLVESDSKGSIRLTARGTALAARVDARRQVVAAYLQEVLGVAAAVARAEAGHAERGFGDGTIDRMEQALSEARRGAPIGGPVVPPPREATLGDLSAGDEGVISLIRAPKMVYDDLLDMGLLPDATVRVVRRSARGIVVSLGGFEITLTDRQARAVVVVS